MAAMASPSSMTLIPAHHHGAAPSTSGDSSLRLLRAQPRHGRRGRGVPVSTAPARRRPFVFTPRAVSDSKSSQTCLDPDASTVRPHFLHGECGVSVGAPGRLSLLPLIRRWPLGGAFAVPDGKLGRDRKRLLFYSFARC